jgi:hypothetical protein
MTTVPLSTAAAANFFIAALTLTPTPTVSPFASAVTQQDRIVQKRIASGTSAEGDVDRTLAHVEQATSIAAIGLAPQYDETDRLTTPQERLVGELRGWALLAANWDGEGVAAPNGHSLKEAVSFVRLLGDGVALPEPMLHATGHAGLFWKKDGFYADIEFLGDGRLAYYIECQGGKHKGVLNFDSKEMPAVLSALLQA